MQLLLTKGAQKNYFEIHAYLTNEWGQQVASAFQSKTENFFNLLTRFPEIGSLEIEDKSIRGFTLTKHTKVFYRLKEDKIIILAFFDNRQEKK